MIHSFHTRPYGDEHTVAYGDVAESSQVKPGQVKKAQPSKSQPSKSQPRKGQLTKGDWAEAALAALAEGGLAAIAIEPLAARLGATKGSAYWHFPNREALVRAALERWELEQTDAVIARVEVADEPREQLRLLFVAAFADPESSRVQLALHAAAADPVVAPVLARVTERRIDYLAMLYGKIGFPAEDAARRAVLAYTTYLGTIQLRRSVRGMLPADGDAEGWRRYLDDATRALMVSPHG
jgi:AcrR family transcriptional regulator